MPGPAMAMPSSARYAPGQHCPRCGQRWDGGLEMGFTPDNTMCYEELVEWSINGK